MRHISIATKKQLQFLSEIDLSAVYLSEDSIEFRKNRVNALAIICLSRQQAEHLWLQRQYIVSAAKMLGWEVILFFVENRLNRYGIATSDDLTVTRRNQRNYQI